MTHDLPLRNRCGHRHLPRIAQRARDSANCSSQPLVLNNISIGATGMCLIIRSRIATFFILLGQFSS